MPSGLLNPPRPRQASKADIPKKTECSCCCRGSAACPRAAFPKECLLGPLSPRPQWKPWWPPHASAAPAATAPTRATGPAPARRPAATASPRTRTVPRRRRQRRLPEKCLRSMALARVGGDVISYTSYLVIQRERLASLASLVLLRGATGPAWWSYLQCMWLLMKIVNCSIRHVMETV